METFKQAFLVAIIVLGLGVLYCFSHNGRYQPVICGPHNEVCAVIDTHTGYVDFARPRQGAEAAQK
jgi:hypothetical protein